MTVFRSDRLFLDVTPPEPPQRFDYDAAIQYGVLGGFAVILGVLIVKAEWLVLVLDLLGIE